MAVPALAAVLWPMGPVLGAPSQPPSTVIQVRVEGNKHLSDAAVLSHVKTRPGRPYNEQVVRDDKQALLITRRFDTVVVEKIQTDKGIIVTFKVTERQVVRGVRFEGNKSVEEKELRNLLTFGSGDPIDMYQIVSATRAIESHYRSEGYSDVRVTRDEDALTRQQIVAFRIVEGPRSFIRKIRFKGNQSFSARRLMGIIKSRRRIWIFRPGVLDLETVERDVVDLSYFYRSKGFLDVQVGSDTTDTPDKKQVDLVLVIVEGPRYQVRETLFEGAKVFSQDELRKDLKLARGEFYDGESIALDIQKIRDLYGEIGYIDMQVSAAPRHLAPGTVPPSWYRPPPGQKPALVDVVYKILESNQYMVGRIDIRGNTTTKMSVIRREFRISPGQLYNTVAADETRKRLMETGLFKDVAVTPFGNDPRIRNAVVTVTEGQTAQFIVGAGVSSNAGLLGNVSLTERNFDLFNWSGKGGTRPFKGGGQTFSISAEPGTEFMRFHISWREPSLFDKPYSLGTKVYVFTSGRETWDETRVGSVVSVGRLFKNRWYGEVAGRLESVNEDNLSSKAPPDVLASAGTSTLAGVKGTLVRDRTDSRWLPSTGDRIIVSYEQVAGDWDFGRLSGDYHTYYTVYVDALDRKHILAGRVTGATIFGDAPVYERFFGGGLGSVRGFDYRGISPRQGPGKEVVGGDFSFFAGGEYTFPIVGQNLRGVVFLDSGTVERNYTITDYRVSTGVGLRIHVPFFGQVPMNLNLGVPLMKSSDDDTQIFSFSIGWIF